MGSTRGTIVLIVALVTVFGIEVVSHTMGDESALLKLGALPTNGQLHAEYWRLLTYSFLHLNPLHLLLNVVALWWTGRIVRKAPRNSPGRNNLQCQRYSERERDSSHAEPLPHSGSAIGGSGGLFGLLGVALVLVYPREESRR